MRPKRDLHLMIMNNACYSCITAAAGTCISHSFSFCFELDKNIRTNFTTFIFFVSIDLLDRASARCPKFLTAVEWIGGFNPHMWLYFR